MRSDRRTRYRVGEAFVHMPHSRAMKRLESDLASINAQISKHSDEAEDCDKQMKELKVIKMIFL